MKPWIAFALGGLVAAVIATAVYQKKISSQAPEVAAVSAPAADPAEAPPPPPPVVEQPVSRAMADPPAAERPRTPAKPSPAPVKASPAPVSSEQPVVVPPPAPATVPPSPQPAPPAPVAAAPKEPPAPPPPPPRVARTVTLAEGTLVSVRLLEKVSSETHQPGDSFSATLDQPVVVDGFVIAEKGARAEGKIVESKEAGRVKGVSFLSLGLTRLTSADGQRINVQTATFEKEGPKETTRDAAKVGIGAAIGSAIGAIAGGGKGAAIGGAAGAGAGAGTVMATRGKPAELLVETRLTFKLSAPVSVTEKLP